VSASLAEKLHITEADIQSFSDLPALYDGGGALLHHNRVMRLTGLGGEAASNLSYEYCQLSESTGGDSVAVPALMLKSKDGHLSARASNILGDTSAVAWVLCPSIALEARMKVLKAIAASEGVWNFAALLAVVSMRPPEDDDNDANQDHSSLVAAAFEALPPAVSRRGRLAQEAVIRSASMAFLEVNIPRSLEFGMMLGFKKLATSVKAAGPTCMGRVLRFHRWKALGLRYVSDLPSNHLAVIDGILAAFSTEIMSYVAENVRCAAAEATYVGVWEGDVPCASLLLAALMRVVELPSTERRKAGVHALSHVMKGVPALLDAWKAMTMCLADSDAEVARTACTYLCHDARTPEQIEIISPLLRKLYTEGLRGKLLDHDSRSCVVEAAASLASIAGLSSNSRENLAEVASLALSAAHSAEFVPALQILGRAGSKTSAPSSPASSPLSTVLSVLQTRGQDVVLPACQTLMSMVPPGDTDAIAGISRALTTFSGSASDRVQIAGCLRHLATIEGDLVATRAFLDMLRASPDSSECQVAALLGLEAAASAGDKMVRQEVLGAVEQTLDTEPDTIAAAAAVLKKVCHVGDLDAASPLLRVLARDASARNPKLLAEIIHALVDICPPGDALIITELGKQLSSGSWPVRHVALSAIRSLAPASSHSADAVQLVLKSLRDAHPDVRECAVETLACVAQPGDSEALAALRALMEEEQPVQVEMAVEEALEVLSGDMVKESMLNSVPPSTEQSARPYSVKSMESDSRCSFQLIDESSSQSSFQILESCGSVIEGSESSYQLVGTETLAASANEAEPRLPDLDVSCSSTER